MYTMFYNKYFSQILAWRSTYILCILCLLWQPKRDNVKEETECERCPVQLAVRWKKMLHHKGSFAISLEWGSWCRMEIGWFTDMMVLWIKKKCLIVHIVALNVYFCPNIKEVRRCIYCFTDISKADLKPMKLNNFLSYHSVTHSNISLSQSNFIITVAYLWFDSPTTV